MPADYVNKLARMFQDIKVSEDLNQQFKETYRNIKGSIAGNLKLLEWTYYIKLCCNEISVLKYDLLKQIKIHIKLT